MSSKKQPRLKLAVVPHPAMRPSERPGPVGGARDQNRREKASQLAAAALELFLAQGIESTRIDEIAERAGVAKGSFYRYFADKTQLVETLFAPITAAVGAALERCERDIQAAPGRRELLAAYTTMGLALGVLVATHGPAIRLYLQERRAPAVGARTPVVELARLLEQRAEKLSHSARERGLLRADLPARVSSLAVVGAAEQLLHAFLSGTTLGNPADVPAQLVALIMDGMRPR